MIRQRRYLSKSAMLNRCYIDEPKSSQNRESVQPTGDVTDAASFNTALNRNVTVEKRNIWSPEELTIRFSMRCRFSHSICLIAMQFQRGLIREIPGNIRNAHCDVTEIISFEIYIKEYLFDIRIVESICEPSGAISSK